MGNQKSVQRKVTVDKQKKNEMKRKANSVQLKVFVDEKKKKVMFAEAQEDFVEILFSFFTLPLGKIARLSRPHADLKSIKVGSLSSLYESVVRLNENHFYEKWYKDCLVYPKNSSAHVCQKLKVNLDEMKPVNCMREAMFFRKKASFIITDDLKVVPLVLDTSIALLNSLGVESIDLLDERTIYFGVQEFLNLLKWSLLTKYPLTNMVFGGSKPCSLWYLTDSTLSNSAFMSSNSSQTPKVKLLVQKSKNNVLFAQVENSFVELLFSFLTIPLGAYVRLTKDSSSRVGISNLYDSISCLGEGKYFKSEDVKTMLLRPKVAPNYHCVTDLLPIYEVNTHPGRFLKEQATFIVSDDLKITSSPSIATISKFSPPGVPIGDMEVVELSIGEQEALLLLNASLTSTSALTRCLKAFRQFQEDYVPNVGRGSEKEAEFTLHKRKMISMHNSPCY